MNRNAVLASALVIGLTLSTTTRAQQFGAEAPATQPVAGDSRQQATDLLRQARTAMRGGNYALAERFIAQAEKFGTPKEGILSRFSDTPEKARRDLVRMQQQSSPQSNNRLRTLFGNNKSEKPQPLPVDATAGAAAIGAAGLSGAPGNPAAARNVVPGSPQAEVQARSAMAQARAAFDRGDLNLATSLVHHVQTLKVNEKTFAGGDTPWELGLKIDRQRRLTGAPPAGLPLPSAQSTPGATMPAAGTFPQTPRVAPAIYDPSSDTTYVRPASAEEAIPGQPVFQQPPFNAIAQQLPGLSPLPQQPQPFSLTGEVPGVPSGSSTPTLGGITNPGVPTGPTPPATLGGFTNPAAPPTTSTPAFNNPAAPQPTLPATPGAAPVVAPFESTQDYARDPFGPAAETNGENPENIQPQPTFLSPETGGSGSGSSNDVTRNEAYTPDSYSVMVNPNELIRMGEQAIRDNKLTDARDHFREAWSMQDQLDPATRQRLQEQLQLLRDDSQDEEDEVTDEEREEAQRIRRFVTDVQREQQAIARDLRDNPRDAWERMKQLRQMVVDADVPDEVRRPLIGRLDEAVNETEAYIETNRARIELDERNRDVLTAIKRERDHRVEVENRLLAMSDEFNELMDQQRYPEAYQLARQAREVAPRHEVSEVMLWKSQFANRLAVEAGIRDRRNRQIEFALDPVDLDTPDAYEYPIAFPKEWDQLVGRREALLGRDSSRLNEAEKEIERSLRKKVQVQFEDTPLSEVIDTLARQAGINVFLDNEGLAAEGVTSDTPVTINLTQEISLQSVLNLILGQHRLGYIIQDEVLRITSETARAGDVYPETYYVGDLVIPIPNFMPGYNNGMAGALAQAHAALGYGPGGWAHNRNQQQAPLVIAENEGDQNVGSPLALGQLNSANAVSSFTSAQPPGPGGMGGASGADFDTLINLITSTVAPNSWDDVGGPGAIESFDGNLSLVISNTQEVHEQIVDLLEQLRRLQDLQVTIEVRFITLQDNFFERIGVDFDFDINDNTGLTQNDLITAAADGGADEDDLDVTIGLDPQGNPTLDLDLSFSQNSFASAIPTFGGFDQAAATTFGFAILSDIEAFFVVEAIQGDSRTNVMQAPKITMFNGQFATINDTNSRPFVTSVIPVVGDFAVAQQPVILVLAEGTQLSVQAVVSSDRRFVRLTMMPMFSQIGDVDTFTFEGRTSSDTGSSTETDPDDNTTTTNNNNVFTEGTTVQLPNFATTSVTTTVSVPDGGTVLMGGIKRLAENRTERGLPILSKLPYVSRLFKNVGIGRDTQTLMMMVTPRIIIQEEEEEKVLRTSP